MVTAKLNHLRISARKLRLIVDLIRGKSVAQAEQILNFAVKRGGKDILKLLKSATAGARHNFQLEESNLYIAKITVDDGPKLKRWMPRARGSASPIQKKTSHITIILDEIARQKTEHLGGPAPIPKSFGRESGVKTEKPVFKLATKAPKPKTSMGGLRRVFKRKVI